MQKLITYMIISLGLFLTQSLHITAQGTSPVGINFIIVNFNEAPTTLSVSAAPLKYNKDFALSMQIDDANISLFTHGYPVFEGGVVNGTTYPGLSYSDGCGNSHSFKMSASMFVFNGNSENGPDIHVDNSYGQLSWEQMDTIYNHKWGILNHGVNSDANTNPLFIDYSISRNKSYTRRQLYNTTEGGVITDIFVNPNGSSNWTIPAFNLGNISALNQNTPSPIGDNGGNVNDPGVDWTQPQNLYRKIAESTNVTSLADGLASSSINGDNFWCPIFTHSLINNYSFSNFASDFNYIANTYGVNGLDNILMTTDEEIQDYLIVRDATVVNYVINGTSMLITYSGEVPDNLLYYSSSIVIASDATINNIIIDGTNDYTYTGIGNTNALINLNWDGKYVLPPENFADSMVTIAATTQTQYNSWIAMDYVITLTNGNHKDSLREVLCNIPNMTYDDGFCDCEIDIQPVDTTINFGVCINLQGAIGDYTYEWFIGDSLVDITQDIYKCPIDTTQYNHIATNTYGCPAEDSIVVNINFLSFDLGPDTTICEGNCLTITGPPDMFEYNWFVADTLFDTVQIITPCPTNTTQYTLWVEDTLGGTAIDSISINVLPTPVINIQPSDTTINYGACIELFGAVGDYTYEWFVVDSLVDTTQDIYTCPIDTTQYNHIATNVFGCSAEDSILVNIEFLSFDLGPNQTICENSCITIAGPPNMIEYNWFVADTLFDTIQIITPCPTEITQYTLWVVNEYGETASDSIIISLKPVPMVDFEEDSLYVSLGNNILLTVNSSSGEGNTFSWTYDGNTEFTFADNFYNLIHPTLSDYVFVNLQSENECTANDSTYLTVLEYPEITVSNDTSICSQQPVILNVSGGDLFLWIVDNDTLSTDSTIIVFPEVSTNYIAQTAYANSSNYSIDTVEVTIFNSTNTKILFDTNTFCTYSEVQLTASGAESYLWIPSEDTSNIYTFNIIDTTTIWLVGMNDDGCQSIDSATFYNKPAPDVNFTGLDPVFCENDSWVTLTGTPSGGIFQGEGIVGYRFYPQNTEPGVHEIVYTYVNQENCIGYDTNITNIYGNGGSIDLGPDFTIDYDSSTTLDAGLGFDSYFWTTGATTQNIIVHGNEKSPGIYEYAVMGVINGCSTRGSINITFENADDYFENNTHIFNIFPNPNDGNFSIKLTTNEKDVLIRLYDIQGQLLYELNNISCDKDCLLNIHLKNNKSGIYFLHIITPSGISTNKVIIKK